ncbi:MAG: hypothetical protein CMK70_03805 [Pseudohongiella sp.]|nr:hypothetical protein [Pseudohongiella sp.]
MKRLSGIRSYGEQESQNRAVDRERPRADFNDRMARKRWLDIRKIHERVGFTNTDGFMDMRLWNEQPHMLSAVLCEQGDQT